MEAPEEKKIRDMEYLILLILGKSNGKISLLHLQKIFFFLWKFHLDVRRLTNFIPHIKGPFSSGIDEIVKNPYHLSKCWLYKPPRNDVERIQGGYLIISKSGQRKYNILLRKLNKIAKKKMKVLHTFWPPSI